MPDPFFRPDETLPVAGLARRSGPATAAERAGLSAPRGVSAPRGATRDQSDALDEGCRFEALPRGAGGGVWAKGRVESGG